MKKLFAYLSQAIFIILVMPYSVVYSSDDDNPILQDNRHYSYIYWENGYPTREAQSRRPQSWANTNARENPDLVIQTGYYSLVLDAKNMQIKGYDSLEGSNYVDALHEDVTKRTPASLTLKAYQNGVEYTASSATLQDGADVHIRLIESGQFLQRYDHVGIIFTAQDGSILDTPARLEISAWPEQVTFKLDFANFEGTAVNIDRTVIELSSPSGKNYLSDVDGIAALLSVRPHEDTESLSLEPTTIITEATDLQNDNALAVEFDNDLHALKVNLPISGVDYPQHIDRVDEFIIEVSNPTQGPLDIPLVFEENVPRAITGTVMLLTDADDGKPSGIPVQISKNWHKNTDTGVKAIHRGNWLRGSTYLTLPAGVTKRLKLKVVFGYWAQAGAASHSQLSLIGWGGNWKWDESALGSWGESMTYDPTQHLGSAFMDDIRPAFTPSMSNGDSHNWTENVGGGDFLIYFDENNRYRWGKRLKTAYVWTGPNMTQVMYSGITDDDKIRFEYISKLVSTNDYHRRFHNYRYEFLEEVVDPKRLVFYQMAADYYLGPDFDSYYIGDRTGLLQESSAEAGGNAYKADKFSFSDRWIASNDLIALDKNEAKANRGIIQRSSKLNDSDLAVYMHKYGRSWGSDKMLFDLSGESVTQSYQAGDVVTGEFEFVLTPKIPANYWGADTEFAARLATYTQPWESVFDEYRYNNELQVIANKGTLVNNFPIEVKADQSGPALIADLSIQNGGIGHIPVIIKDAVIGKTLGVERFVNDAWVALEVNASTQNSYYQGYQNASGKIDYAFSIPRSSNDLAENWRIRFSYETPLLPETMTGDLEAYLNNLDVGNADDNLWEPPTPANLLLAQETIQLLSSEKYTEAQAKAQELGGYIIAFDDTSSGSTTRYYIFHIAWQALEDNKYRTLGGTYVFNPSGKNISIQVPHPSFDSNTNVQGITTFFGLQARYLLVSGTHRNSSTQQSTCQTDYRVSDAAHNANHYFQSVHQAIDDLSNETLFIQLHGFGSETREKLRLQCDASENPLLLNMSTGVGDIDPINKHSFMHLLHKKVNDAGSIRSCIYSPSQHASVNDVYSTSLGGTLNTNGRYTNGSTDVCSASAATSSERFLHLEQSYEVRRDQRDIMLNHLKSAWTDYAASPDLVPDPFSLNQIENAAVNSEQVSSPLVISGFNRSLAISIIDGEYSINNAGFTSAAGTVNSGDSIVVRHTSSNNSAAQKNTTLNIGGFSKIFSSMTMNEQTTTSNTSNNSGGGGSLPINMLIVLSILLGLNHLARRRHFKC